MYSKHALDEDYSVMFSGLTTFDFERRFRKDDIGNLIHGTCISMERKPAESRRSERKVRKYAFSCYDQFSIVLHLCLVGNMFLSLTLYL